VITRLLELIHMNLFGLIKTKSLGGTRYVYVLVDDFSSRRILDFLAYAVGVVSRSLANPGKEY